MSNNYDYFIAVKSSYYRLAKLYHPDRVADSEKEEAKQKFHIIHDAYTILSDATKKHAYDNGSDVLFSNSNTAKWEHFLKQVDANDIGMARVKYQGSLQEKDDLKREFVNGNGSFTHLMNTIPFMRREDEERIMIIVKSLMEDGHVPKISIKKLRK